MSAEPSYLSTLEYSRRWGIGPMFSDFKSRGFGIQDTQIQYPDRLGRLILVMSLALWPELTKRPELTVKRTDQEHQAALTKASAIVRSGLIPLVFSDTLYWRPRYSRPLD